ncbi:MAG: hypothetical protein KAS93_04230 [Gammaproteobacteria bacterium]|nr:hypothetical protein [Gammaproteobacteria bacterium]
MPKQTQKQLPQHAHWYNDLGRESVQLLVSAGHLIPEGVGKPLGLATTLGFLGCPINWWSVFGACTPLILLNLINQANYVARTTFHSLPAKYQARKNFEQHLLKTGEITRDPEDQHIPYHTNALRRVKLYTLVLANVIIEGSDGIAAIFAVAPKDLNKFLILTGGIIAGFIKSGQSTLVIVRRGNENVAADHAMRHGQLLPPLEQICKPIEFQLRNIARLLSYITPAMFGILHTMATSSSNLVHETLKKYLGDILATGAHYASWPFLYLLAAYATSCYDIEKLGQDIFGDNRLGMRFALADWFDKKLAFWSKHEEPSTFNPNNPWAGWLNFSINHPCRAAARQLYGYGFAHATNALFPKMLALLTQEACYGSGLFYLFNKALRTVYEEVFSKLIGESAATTFDNMTIGPHVIFGIISVCGSYAQMKQKWPALKRHYHSDRKPPKLIPPKPPELPKLGIYSSSFWSSESAQQNDTAIEAKQPSNCTIL